MIATASRLSRVSTAVLIPIAGINKQGRSRKVMGDVRSLAASIERLGLLHPIVVTADYKLIVGRRRIEAFRLLGRTQIPATIAHNIGELNRLLEAEADENTCRLTYSPEEAVHLGGRFEPIARQLAKAEQAKSPGRPKNADTEKGRKSFPTFRQDESKRTIAQVAAVVGMSRPTFERAAAVMASGCRELIDEMNRTRRVSGVYKKLVVRQKSAEIAKEPPPLPDGRYRVIVCDPPWEYDNRPNDVTRKGLIPYPSMSTTAIKAIPVASRAHRDCVLWLWATNAHLPEAFSVAESWGFAYKTLLTWGKSRMRNGNWLRGQTEHCLMCVRGRPTVALTTQTTLLHAKVRGHSEKPDEFYRLVEELCPGSKLELFQRKPRRGWVGFGV